MNPIEFTSQQAPKSKKALNIVVLIILVFLLSLNTEVRKGIQLAISDPSQLFLLIKIVVIGGLIIAIISYLFFFKKIYNNFSLDDQGINISNRKIAWSDVKNWHMLGDSQDERTGLGSIKRTGGFDVVNLYAGMNIFVLKTKSGFINNTVRLQLSQERVEEFIQLLQNHGLMRETKTRMYFTNVSPWFVILFIIPFGLIVLLFVFVTIFNK